MMSLTSGNTVKEGESAYNSGVFPLRVEFVDENTDKYYDGCVGG